MPLQDCSPSPSQSNKSSEPEIVEKIFPEEEEEEEEEVEEEKEEEELSPAIKHFISFADPFSVANLPLSKNDNIFDLHRKIPEIFKHAVATLPQNYNLS